MSVTLERVHDLIVQHGWATAETVASRTPLQEIRDAIRMAEKGSCYMPERMWFAARVAELGAAHPECAEWAEWFAATRQWNAQQIEARDAWRARWADRVRSGWSCRPGFEPDGYEEAVAEAMAERDTMVYDLTARNSMITSEEVAVMTTLERVGWYAHLPSWMRTIPDWLRRGYCDSDGKAAGGAYTRLPPGPGEFVRTDP